MKNKNLKLLYLHEICFQFTDSMLLMVLAVFIYKLFNSISAYFIFDFIWNLFFGILMVPLFNIGMKLKKPKYMMVLGMIFYVLMLWFFSKTTPENIHFIIPGTIFFILYVSFYWLTKHWFFSINFDHLKVGNQVGKMIIIKVLLGFIGPIIAGWLSFFVSFQMTFLIGALVGIVGVIPIFFFEAPPHKEEIKLKDVYKILKRPELKAVRPAHIFEGVAGRLLRDGWLLAFAIFIGTIFDLGLLMGVTVLFTAILIRLTGKWFDGRSRKKSLSLLTHMRTVSSMFFTLIYFFPSTIFIWTVQIINNFISNMHDTVLASYVYGYSSKIHPVYFNLNREMGLFAGRFITSGLMAIVFLFLSANYLWLIIAIGALSLQGWHFLKRSDHLLH